MSVKTKKVVWVENPTITTKKTTKRKKRKARKPNADQVKAWKQLWKDAHAEGMKAAMAHTPTPMIVGSPTTFLGNDIDPNKPVYYVSGGVCGWANVYIKPARGAFCQWLLANDLAGKNSYRGGITLRAWTDFKDPRTQSLELNEVYAHAFAQVLRDAGINGVAVESRMD